MEKSNKKKLLIIIACILAVVGVVCKIIYPGEPINNTIKEFQNIVYDQIEIIDKEVPVVDITENEDVSSDVEEIEELTVEDEAELEEEVLTESESFELQDEENISYDGDRSETWGVELGDFNGLTYYSQIDSRWKNNLYTSTNNTTQTIGSSGCGPTSAAMVVSSIKGTITPDTMANLFVKYGYRSANNGTYWSAYRAVANEFNIGYTETSDIQKALDLLKNKNYVIVSCGNGLFTTGGHYIVIVGIEENTLKIYDPYLYDGKFNISTRRGKVEVSGNTIYCSIDNFRKYSNYKGFFCYQDIEHNISKFKAGEKVVINVPVGIAVNSGKKWLVDDGQTQFWINKSVITDDNRIYGLADICYNGGTIDIVQIFDSQFWCNEKYMSTQITEHAQIRNTVGQIQKIKQNCIIYQNKNLSGLNYNYKANTSIKILKNISADVDYVQVIQTGRKGYMKNNNYK